jgi:hypothetical protein
VPLPRRYARRLALWALCVLLLIVGSAVYELGRKPGTVPRMKGLPCLLDFRTLGFAAGFPLQLATNGDDAGAHRPIAFWYLRPRQSRDFLVRVRAAGPTTKTSPIAVIPRLRSQTYDLTTWAGRQALVVVRRARSGIFVRIFALPGARRRLFQTFVPVPEPTHLVRRDIAVATRSRRPDLYVIDWAGPAHAVTLTIYSGDSRFRDAILRRNLPLHAEPHLWRVDVAPVAGGSPDLVFFRLAAHSLTHSSEIHVLSGKSGFELFTTHARLSHATYRASQFAVGPSAHGPAAYAVTHESRASKLIATPIATPRTNPRC